MRIFPCIELSCMESSDLTWMDRLNSNNGSKSKVSVLIYWCLFIGWGRNATSPLAVFDNNQLCIFLHFLTLWCEFLILNRGSTNPGEDYTISSGNCMQWIGWSVILLLFSIIAPSRHWQSTFWRFCDPGESKQQIVTCGVVWTKHGGLQQIILLWLF